MSLDAVDIWLNGLTTVEIGVLTAAGLSLFRKWGATFAEAAAYALMAALMILSFGIQLAFLMRFPALSMGWEILFSAAALVALYRWRSYWRPARRILIFFLKGHPLLMAALVVGGLFLTSQALRPPLEDVQSQSLQQVRGFHQQGAFFPTVESGQTNQPLQPVNLSSLALWDLRRHHGRHQGFFGLMAWAAIALATYALARRYAWPPTALTVALVTITYPRLVHLAVSGDQEIIAAAAALFCLLAIYRVVEQPNRKDLLIFILGLLFGVSGQDLGFLFPLVLTLLAGMLLFRRHGVMAWWKLISGFRWYMWLIIIPPLFIFSQVWLFGCNRWIHGQWLELVHAGQFTFNTDGISGALANLIRYLMAFMDVTPPVERCWRYLFGFGPSDSLMGLYEFLVKPYLGDQGAAAAFSLAQASDMRFMGFGPFGFLLVLPALFYALIRGPRRLKAIAVALVGYFYLIALIPAWRPVNVRFFTLFFVCGGYFNAFFLPPWRLTRTRQAVLQTVCLLLWGYACWVNLV